MTVGVVQLGSPDLFISARQILRFYDPVRAIEATDPLDLKGRFTPDSFELTGSFVGTCYAPGVCLKGGNVYVNGAAVSKGEVKYLDPNGTGSVLSSQNKILSRCELTIDLLGTEMHVLTAWPVPDFSVPVDRLHITPGVTMSGPFCTWVSLDVTNFVDLSCK